LPTIVETVKEALKLPYVAITLATDDQRPMTNDGSESTVDWSTIAAASGSPVGNSVRLPLVYQGETVGELVLAPRTPGETFGAADRRLLQDLAHQIGVAVHAVHLTADLQRLTTDLQRSRERLVLAREEERRRLRRDLHDGLGPTLAALALTASNVGDLIPINPSAATALATDLQNEIRATVADIRRLVYDLRPPALDELGIVAAIRERAIQIGRRESEVGNRGTEDGGPGSRRLKVIVEAPEHLPPLPAAVEVATYRIVQEALTNVVRHAQADTCIVRLSLTDALEVEIVDDGAGLPPEHPAGVGLFSMRERAAELGGSCVIERNHGNGTRVYARLPVDDFSATE
jgi:signal transduction histidine kinase